MTYSLRALLNTIQLYENAIKHDGNIKKLYHITAKDNVNNILEQGILPRSNKYYGDLNVTEYENAIFLTDDYKEIIAQMSEHMHSWSDDKIVLLINTDGFQLYYDSGMVDGYDENRMNSFYYDKIIAPNHIIALIDPKSGKQYSQAELKSNSSVLDKDTERHDAVYAHGYLGSESEVLIKFNMVGSGREDAHWKVQLLGMIDDTVDPDDPDEMADLKSSQQSLQVDFDAYMQGVRYVPRNKIVSDFNEWLRREYSMGIEFDEVSSQQANTF